MPKQAVTLESLNYLLEKIDKRFETMDKRFETMDKRFEAIDKRFDYLDRNIEDTMTSTQYLVANAVTRTDVREIVCEEISPVKSELLAAIDAIGHKQERFEGEVLAMRYDNDQLNRRVGVVEQTLGLPKMA